MRNHLAAVSRTYPTDELGNNKHPFVERRHRSTAEQKSQRRRRTRQQRLATPSGGGGTQQCETGAASATPALREKGSGVERNRQSPLAEAGGNSTEKEREVTDQATLDGLGKRRRGAGGKPVLQRRARKGGGGPHDGNRPHRFFLRADRLAGHVSPVCKPDWKEVTVVGHFLCIVCCHVWWLRGLSQLRKIIDARTQMNDSAPAFQGCWGRVMDLQRLPLKAVGNERVAGAATGRSANCTLLTLFVHASVTPSKYRSCCVRAANYKKQGGLGCSPSRD